MAGGAAEIVPGIKNNTCKLKKGTRLPTKPMKTKAQPWPCGRSLGVRRILRSSTTQLLLTFLLRMTEVESRLYATTSLGLDGGDVQVFLDFLEDERDKRPGMIEDSDDYGGAGSSDALWQHLPLPPSFPGQPRSALAAAAVVMAQEQEAQLWPDPIQDAAMDIDRDQGLGTTIGTSLGPPPQCKLSKLPPGFLLQVVKVCLPGHQVGDGVETVTSNDNQECHAPQVMTPHPLMVSPLSVARQWMSVSLLPCQVNQRNPTSCQGSCFLQPLAPPSSMPQCNQGTSHLTLRPSTLSEHQRRWWRLCAI